ALLVPERGITLLQVQWDWVMQGAADLMRFEMLFKFVAAGMAHDVQMVATFRVIGFERQLQRGIRKQFVVTMRHAAALLRPFVQVLELYSQNRALNAFHAVVETHLVVIVTLR